MSADGETPRGLPPHRYAAGPAETRRGRALRARSRVFRGPTFPVSFPADPPPWGLRANSVTWENAVPAGLFLGAGWNGAWNASAGNQQTGTQSLENLSDGAVRPGATSCVSTRGHVGRTRPRLRSAGLLPLPTAQARHALDCSASLPRHFACGLCAGDDVVPRERQLGVCDDLLVVERVPGRLSHLEAERQQPVGRVGGQPTRRGPGEPFGSGEPEQRIRLRPEVGSGECIDGDAGVRPRPRVIALRRSPVAPRSTSPASGCCDGSLARSVGEAARAWAGANSSTILHVR